MRWIRRRVHASLAAGLLALGVGLGSAAAIATEQEQPLEIRASGGSLSIVTPSMAPAEIAMAVADAAGVRIDGIEHLQGAERTRLSFQTPIPVPSVLTLLADGAGVLVLSGGPGHYAFSGPGEGRRSKALTDALFAAYEGGDEAAIDDAQAAMLDFIRPPPEGPVMLASAFWFEVAQRAEDAGDLGRAEALVRDGVAHVERLYGPSHVEYGLALGKLGRLRWMQDDKAGAIELMERGHAIAAAELGPVHADLARMQIVLAMDRTERGKPGEAEQLLQRAIEGFGDVTGPDAIRLGFALSQLAALYVEQERLAEAEPLLQRSFELHRSAFGEDQAGFQAWQLSDVLYRRGDLLRARPLLEYAIAADAPGRERMQHQLTAIDRLGPLADPASGPEALDALRDSLSADPPPFPVLLEMAYALDQHAASQYRDDPDGTAWRTSCAASAEVKLVRADVPGANAQGLRRTLVDGCHREVEGAAAPD